MPLQIFKEAVQALLTIEAKEMQTNQRSFISRPIASSITAHVYLFMLAFYETLYFGACYVLSAADVKVKIHIWLKIQRVSGITCIGMHLPCVGIFIFIECKALIKLSCENEQIKKLQSNDPKQGRPGRCEYAHSQPPTTGCEMTLLKVVAGIYFYGRLSFFLMPVMAYGCYKCFCRSN